MRSRKRTDFFVIVRATMTSNQASVRRRRFQADGAGRPAAVPGSGNRLAILPEANAVRPPAEPERESFLRPCPADLLFTVCGTPFHARERSRRWISASRRQSERLRSRPSKNHSRTPHRSRSLLRNRYRCEPTLNRAHRRLAALACPPPRRRVPPGVVHLAPRELASKGAIGGELRAASRRCSCRRPRMRHLRLQDTSDALE